MIKTITITGDEVEVTIGGQYCNIRNDGVDIIYASTAPGITAGADGVISIPAGGAVVLPDVRGTVYLLGTGGASLVGKDDGNPVFKPAAAAGGGEDTVARTKISAHEGNTEVHVTEAEKAKWDKVNYSNPNLLINPDFAVNQRGSNVYSSAGYTCDMWKIDTNGTVQLNSNGVTVNASSIAPTWFFQSFENPFILDGKTVALSVCDANDNVFSGTGFVPAGQLSDTLCVIDVPVGEVNAQLWKRNDNILLLQVALPLGTTVSIKWIKLEIGDVPTGFEKPDAILETLKCQRYYQIRSTGDIAAVDLRPTMRTITDIKQRSDGNYEYIAEL